MHTDRIFRNWSMIMISVICLSWASIATAGPGNRQGPPPPDFIEHHDQDGDGMVSQEEFTGPANHFSDLDRNGDGFISEDEKPTGPPPNPVEAFDQDGDGMLTIDEFQGPDEHFQKLDQNGDGYIDESEATGGPGGRRRGPMRMR